MRETGTGVTHSRESTSDPLVFFATPGALTEAGSFGVEIGRFPDDLADLARIVQGLVIHVYWRHHYGVAPDASRNGELQLRTAAQKLARIRALDPHPLVVSRPPERRLIGNCRDMTLLLVAMLRHHAVPARARAGFARYFAPDHYEDHWVCEYWREGENRWALADAQLDPLQRDRLAIPFDPLDVPRDQFIVAGEAWRRALAGEADPETFGIGDLHGLWMARENLVRDIAALNKVELLPWDRWGIMLRGEDLDDSDTVALDHLAALTAGDVPAVAMVWRAFESDRRWRVPPVIQSHGPEGAREVNLLADLAAD